MKQIEFVVDYSDDKAYIDLIMEENYLHYKVYLSNNFSIILERGLFLGKIEYKTKKAEFFPGKYIGIKLYTLKEFKLFIKLLLTTDKTINGNLTTYKFNKQEIINFYNNTGKENDTKKNKSI